MSEKELLMEKEKDIPIVHSKFNGIIGVVCLRHGKRCGIKGSFQCGGSREKIGVELSTQKHQQ